MSVEVVEMDGVMEFSMDQGKKGEGVRTFFLLDFIISLCGVISVDASSGDEQDDPSNPSKDEKYDESFLDSAEYRKLTPQEKRK